MHRLTDNKIILVTRPTRVAELKRRFSTRTQAKFYVSHLGQDFSDYEREDELYAHAVREAQQTLDSLGRVQVIDRSFLPNFVFGPQDIVVVMGQDGLVANTVKYLDGQPVVGVNPDPARWDGQLLPFKLPDLGKVMPEILQRRRPTKAVTMAKATLNTGETMHAVNDIFVGPRTHGSARYTISVGGRTENQSSSGVIVSTGVGSTGWFKSLLAGAAGIVQSAGSQTAREAQEDLFGKAPPLPGKQRTRTTFSARSEFPWDADYLCFTVREPFPTRTTQASIVFGRVTEKQPLILVSQMPENGVIFSDGIEQDFLEFRSGARATVGIAEKRGCLVV
ncbi:MAG: sugar kinase [Verrucomicrobia bacterium]|nr:sugar kinase [Verrucomicrobiota bacterium]